MATLRALDASLGAGFYTFRESTQFAKLEGLGLVLWRENRRRGSGVGRFHITDAGRAALAQVEAA